jgi:hypothetical protein
MAPRTLAHHRKGNNKYVFTFGRQTITVTRRFLPSRSVRVRVTSQTISGQGDGNWTEYRDFTDMHDGDAAYSKQATRFCTQWEERYCSTPKKKETPVTEEPTPDTRPEPTATHWAGGATMTPSRAAELAAKRTGVRHAMTEDGRALCRVPADAPTVSSAKALATAARRAVEGKVVGRVLGEYAIRFKGPRRLGRTDAMSVLLKTQTMYVAASEAETRALFSDSSPDPQRVEQAADLQVKATYFRALRDTGYTADTTWDELIEMLRPVLSTALQGLHDQRTALAHVNAVGQRSIQRSIDAAEAFIIACQPVLSFFRDADED